MENKWLGLFALALSTIVVFVWIPLDVDTGLFEKVRRSVQIGDAFAPTIAASLIGLGGLFILIARSPQPSAANSLRSDPPSLINNLFYALVLLLILAVGFSLMRYAGPVVVRLINVEKVEYRVVRDTVPWKYIGFTLGGTFLVTALIAWTERKLRLVHLLIGLGATLMLIALYDLPFDDLLLPPNGDV